MWNKSNISGALNPPPPAKKSNMLFIITFHLLELPRSMTYSSLLPIVNKKLPTDRLKKFLSFRDVVDHAGAPGSSNGCSGPRLFQVALSRELSGGQIHGDQEINTGLSAEPARWARWHFVWDADPISPLCRGRVSLSLCHAPLPWLEEALFKEFSHFVSAPISVYSFLLVLFRSFLPLNFPVSLSSCSRPTFLLHNHTVCVNLSQISCVNSIFFNNSSFPLITPSFTISNL